jgi:hypothetical protein
VKYLAIVLFVFVCGFHCAGRNIKKLRLAILPVYAGTQLQPDKDGHLFQSGDTFSLETFRFYISGIELIQDGKTVWKEQDSYHLIDAADSGTLQLLLNTDRWYGFNAIRFNLGIDSTTNVSGALGGDLDPSKGMYWTWQSGYINLKLEGKSKSCPNRNGEFQFHLGGYSGAQASVQEVSLRTDSKKPVTILVDVSKFLSEIDLTQQNSIMIPGSEAVSLSRMSAKMFSVK